MGSLGPPPVPVVDQHGDGSGNAPPKVERSHLDNSRNISLAVTSLLESMAGNPELHSEADAKVILAIIRDAQSAAARELQAGIGTVPLPGPTTGRPPVEPSSRP